jgi:HAD superfamily hydrolase (TIGR01459 family)
MISGKLKNQDGLPILEHIEDIAPYYNSFILDIWGVLHNGIQPYEGTLHCLTKLKENNIKTCLVSNTHHRVSLLKEKLDEMGITDQYYDYIISAAESACIALKNRDDPLHQDLGNNCFILNEGKTKGEDVVNAILYDLNLEIADNAKDATFIMNACGAIDHEELPLLYKKLRSIYSANMPMICLNPDLVVGIGDIDYPCGGALAKYYEDLGGNVIYHGKPHKPIYEIAHKMLGEPDKSKMIAIGDSLHTDIQGANLFGIDCLFNLSGIHLKEVSKNDMILPQKLEELIASQAHRPTAALNGFNW